MSVCGTTCTSTQTDTGNCGGCGQACSTLHGTPSCSAGACTMATCATGYLDCSTSENTSRNGCETYVVTDPNNCGQCGKVCPNDWAHSTPTCAGSTCGHACTAPYDNCDGLATNGCESNLTTDGNNCGHCTNACTSQVCRNQTCLTTTRYGNTGSGTGNSNFGAGYLAGIQVYVPTASVLTGFGVVLYGTTASRNMYLGLYKDVTGAPGDLVATIAASVLVAPGGKEVSVAPAPVDIQAGTYWLLGTWDGSASFASNSTTGVTWRYAAFAPFGPLPSTAPTAMQSSTLAPPNLYVIVAQ
jgi:hypothetical protein